MKPPAERGRSPEHVEALEAFDLAERLVKRHQGMWACGPSTRPERSRHENQPSVKSEHDQLIAARDAARENVRAADPKVSA